MAVDIKVPSVGESITEGIVSRWLKPDGDAVQANEPVFELETDKATTEVVRAGRRRPDASRVKEGQKVAIGSVVGRDPGGARPPPSAARPNGEGGAGPGRRTRRSPSPTAAAAVEPLLSPAARQLAADEGVDPRKVTGTGRGGRVIKEDVHDPSRPAQAAPTGRRREAALRRPRRPPKPSRQANGRETRQRMTTIRQRIAERLLAAQQNAAILTTFNEADMSARHGPADEVQGIVPEEARRRPRLHELLRQGVRRGAEGVPRRQRPHRRPRHRLPELSTTSAWRSAPRRG